MPTAYYRRYGYLGGSSATATVGAASGDKDKERNRPLIIGAILVAAYFVYGRFVA